MYPEPTDHLDRPALRDIHDRHAHARVHDRDYDRGVVPYRDATERNGLWLALGAGTLLGAAGAAWYVRQRAEEERRRRPPDDAPRRASRLSRDGSRPVTGRTVTIDRPRGEVYAYWRDFSNLARFMEHVESVTPGEEGTHLWRIVTGNGREIEMRTRIVGDVENEELRWRTVEGSDLEAEGTVRFRDAPGDRGTEVDASVRYRQVGGALGAVVAKFLQVDPKTQIRRELKRLKMLLETGEIATAANRVADARAGATAHAPADAPTDARGS